LLDINKDVLKLLTNFSLTVFAIFPLEWFDSLALSFRSISSIFGISISTLAVLSKLMASSFVFLFFSVGDTEQLSNPFLSPPSFFLSK